MAGPTLVVVLLAPFFTLLAVGFFLPIGTAVVDTVLSADGLMAPYVDLFTDPVFRTVLIRTFQTATVVTALCLILAYPTAEFIGRARGNARSLLLGVVIVALWTSVIARTYGWVGILQRDGLLARALEPLGFGGGGFLYTSTGVVVGMVHVLMPVLLIPTYVAVQRYDWRLSSASYSAGAGPIRTLVFVKLPVLAPQLLAASAVVFVLTLGFFVTPSLLGGPRSTLMSTLISQQVFQVFNLEKAQAMSILLLIVTLVSFGAFFGVVRLLRRVL